jgi:hypothetical protein
LRDSPIEDLYGAVISNCGIESILRLTDPPNTTLSL